MLMNICRMVWASLLPAVEQGSKKFSLFDEECMPHLYEKFILEYYRQHFLSLHASDKAVQWDIPDDTDFRGASCPKQRMDTVGKSHMGGSDKKAENRQQNSKDCHQDDQQPDLSAFSVEGIGFPGHIKRVS